MYKNIANKTMTAFTNIMAKGNKSNAKEAYINITAIVDDAKRAYLMQRPAAMAIMSDKYISTKWQL